MRVGMDKLIDVVATFHIIICYCYCFHMNHPGQDIVIVLLLHLACVIELAFLL